MMPPLEVGPGAWQHGDQQEDGHSSGFAQNRPGVPQVGDSALPRRWAQHIGVQINPTVVIATSGDSQSLTIFFFCCCSPATVFSCLAIALGVYRLWRWMSGIHPQRQIVPLTTADGQTHQGIISNDLLLHNIFFLKDTQVSSALYLLNTYSAHSHNLTDTRFYSSLY